MSNRRHVSILRILGALILAAAITAGLLFGTDVLTKQMMDGTSIMTQDYFVLAGITAAVLFVLFLFPANRPFERMKRFLRWVAVVAAIVVVWGGGYILNMQKQLMYHPEDYAPETEEAARNLPGLEAVLVPGRSGQQYHGWLWKNAPEEKAGLILYFGGNGQFSAQAVASLSRTQGLGEAFQGYNVMMVDYPGYGLSAGTPGEKSIYEMALAAWEYALTRPEVRQDKMVVAGWSMGTGTAPRLAAEKQAAGLMLLAPFFNGTELISDFTNTHIFKGPLNVLVRDKYPSDVYAPRYQNKALLIAARGDQLIPPAQAERLASLFPSKTLVMVEGGHSAPMHAQPAMQAMAAYLAEVLMR